MELRFGISLGRRAKTKAASGEVTVSPVLMDVLNMLDGTAVSYGRVYRRVAPVRTVVDFVSDAAASAPLKVYRREDRGRPELHDHPLAVLLRNPNPDLNEHQLKQRVFSDLAIYGNAYWWKVVFAGRRMLVPLPPYRVTPRGGDLLSASAYDYFSPTGSPPKQLPASDVVHFRLYDPEDPRVGSSKLEALRSIILEEVEASAHRRGFWRNNARIAGLLRHPGTISEGAQVRLRNQFDNAYVGPENSGKTFIAEEGMDWSPIGVNPKDAEFIEGRKFILEAMAHVFGIPTSLLSLTENATYASQREFRKQLYTEVLPSWFEPVQAQIELQLLSWFLDTTDVYVEFSVESKLRGDFLEQAEVLSKAIGRPWMVVSEGRRFNNLDDRGDPRDDELVVPVGPNYALESMAETEAAISTPALASVTDMTAASALVRFFDRQERSVSSKLGAGESFDRERWNRELAEIVGPERAATINMKTQLLLAAGDEPREVFLRARRRAIAELTA